MSSITGESLIPTKNNAVLYAAGVLMIQALVLFAPLFVRVGAAETRLANVETVTERNRGNIDDMRERLVRIETKQDQVLEAVQARRR